MVQDKNTILPLAIIGMGAAGSMAGIAAGKTVKTVLYDGNEKLGKKIYITGKGRCNLTNTASMDLFLKNVTRNPKFLFSAFHHFTNLDLMTFFEDQGVPLKEERGGRVFPSSDHASDINRALESRLKQEGVILQKNWRLISLEPVSHSDTDQASTLYSLLFDVCGQRRRVCARKVILATGGLSYPSTGSRGEGYDFARKLGHKVTSLTPSLVGIRLSDPWIPSLQGLSLRNVSLEARLGKKSWKEFGEALFTNQGISGPIVLTLSSLLSGRNLDKLELTLDFKPALDAASLSQRLKRERKNSPNRSLKTLFASFLPKSIVPVFLDLGEMDGDKPFHQMTLEEENHFIRLLKSFPLTFAGLEGFNQAVVTRGGVCVKEINPSTMESRICPGLYFAGEILDVDAMTGGYNLQIAFSTGYLAGLSASQALAEKNQEEL